MKKKYIYKATKEIRFLSFLKEQLPSTLSNKAIKTILDKGLCKVNGVIERFGTYKLSKHDEVEVDPFWLKITQKQKEKKCSILYEDEYFLAIDKPTGWVCEDRYFFSIFKKKYFLVHRLDANTSGVLLFAKSLNYKKEMIKLFSKREVKKYYLAVVDKVVRKKKGKIESYLEKKCFFSGQTLWGSSKSNKGKYALTLFEKIEETKNSTTILCQLVTGRTHQLRVHLSELSHPILGDYLYCKKFVYPKYVPRLLLQSIKIEFTHPFSKKDVVIEAPIADEFFSFTTSLRDTSLLAF